MIHNVKQAKNGFNQLWTKFDNLTKPVLTAWQLVAICVWVNENQFKWI